MTVGVVITASLSRRRVARHDHQRCRAAVAIAIAVAVAVVVARPAAAAQKAKEGLPLTAGEETEALRRS